MFGGEEYIPHYSDIAHFLGLEPGACEEHGQGLAEGGGWWRSGSCCHPSLFSAAQRSTILQYVDKCDADLFPLTQAALQLWINQEFNIVITSNSLKKWLEKQSDLYLVSGYPLESARAKLSLDKMRKNGTELERKLAKAHPLLIMNMDESALDATVETQTHKIISSHCCDQSYAAQRGKSHITFVALIATGGWHLPHLAIVKTKSIARVLAF